MADFVEELDALEEVGVEDIIEISGECGNESEPDALAAEPADEQGVVEEVSEQSDEIGTEVAKKLDDNELLQILTAQDSILDCMLTQQKKIHSNIKERKWVELESCINSMNAFSDAFVSLDQCRENFVAGNRSLYLEPEVEPVFCSVRSKLSKSKIENSALATYVSSTKEFIDGIIDTCIPQKRNTLYTRQGQIRRPVAESVILDTVM